jgi:hypothetical protein
VTSGLRQTRCLVIKPKSGAPLSCLDRSGAPAVKVWGNERWAGLSFVCILPAAIVAAAIAFLVRRAFSREALTGQTNRGVL